MWHSCVIYTVTRGTLDVTISRLDSANWCLYMPEYFLGHLRTIQWHYSRDIHVSKKYYGFQQSFLFESFCVPVSPFSPIILINTLASVPAHSISPVVTSISNFVILKSYGSKPLKVSVNTTPRWPILEPRVVGWKTTLQCYQALKNQFVETTNLRSLKMYFLIYYLKIFRKDEII